MINYVQNKQVNYEAIKILLDKSAKLCRFSNGGPVKFELESYLENLFQLPKNKKVVCVSSGTAALHSLMFLYETLTDKDFAWATIAYNFPCPVVNNFNAYIYDITLTSNSYSIDLSKIKPFDGFVLPTLFGTVPENFGECIDFCKKNDIVLLLDNASSPLSQFAGTNICTLGDASIGSLHHTKYLGFGEGGFFVVDKDLHLKADSLTNFGFFQDRKYKPLSSNFKMSDISAAFILSHLKTYDFEAHKTVQTAFTDNLTLFNYSEGVIYGNLPIQFKSPTSQLIFRDYGIEANKYYVPLLAKAPNSNYLFERMVNFPLHADLSDYEINKIIEQIKFQQAL